MPVLNANIRTLNSYAESPKRHNLYMHIYFVLTTIGNVPHKTNSAVLFYFLLCSHSTHSHYFALLMSKSGVKEKAPFYKGTIVFLFLSKPSFSLSIVG